MYIGPDPSQHKFPDSEWLRAGSAPVLIDFGARIGADLARYLISGLLADLGPC